MRVQDGSLVAGAAIGGLDKARSLAWIVLAAVAGLLLLVEAAYGQQTADWTGIWSTKWRGGGAELVLQQTGDVVTGRYDSYNGRIVAKAHGLQLVGHWTEDGRSGEFTFGMSPDGRSFMGRYSSPTGEWWTGLRDDESTYSRFVVNQSSPMFALSSFVRAMNESGADNVERSDGGSMALTSKAASLLIVPPPGPDGLSAIDYAQRLFAVIDKLTFRFWSLPEEELLADEVTITLDQFDTNVSFDLTFRRRDGKWFIVVPSQASLEAKRTELAAARGEPADAVSAPANLRTPRDTFKILLSDDTDHEGGDPAVATLDMRDFSAAVRKDEAELLVRYLRKILDRVGYTYWQEIPDDPKSKTPFVFMEHPAGDIVVGPVETANGVVWQFTQETLNDVRRLYAAVEEMPVAPEFASLVRDDTYFNTRALAHSISPALLVRAGPIERWQWILLALSCLAGLALGYAVSTAFYLLAHWRKRGRRRKRTALSKVMAWSARSIVFGFFLIFAMRVLGLPGIVATPVKALAWTAIVVGAVPLLWYWIGRIGDMYRGHFVEPGYHETLISLLSGLARVILVITAFLLLAEVLAIPYQGVVAGLGIGGLAVALAAQPTMQNFLSGLTLYADRPVSVGDFCRFGDKLGTIEHIGMRSTRIRSPDRTVISVPNADFASMQLENYALRDHIILKTTLQLRYETSPEQLRASLDDIRNLLIADPRIAKDPCRVRFVGFSPSWLEVEILTYVLTADFSEFLEIREDIFLRMMEILDKAGVRLAAPSRPGSSGSDLPVDAAEPAAS